MFFRDAESYNRSILREEKQGGRKDEIKKNNGTITCRMHGGITCSLWKRRREKECKKGWRRTGRNRLCYIYGGYSSVCGSRKKGN